MASGSRCHDVFESLMESKETYIRTPFTPRSILHARLMTLHHKRLSFCFTPHLLVLKEPSTRWLRIRIGRNE